jgi:hypothetical protein
MIENNQLEMQNTPRLGEAQLFSATYKQDEFHNR